MVAASLQATTDFTITTAVTSGQGWIDTTDPGSLVPAGAAKHYSIHPARGWMIEDVQVDGKSIGPSMVASIPFVNEDHAITASFVPFDQIQATNFSTKLNKDTRILFLGPPQAAAIYLQMLIDRDPSIHFTITIDTASYNFDYTGLLGAYYNGPYVTDLMPKVDAGWDYIIAFDNYEQQAKWPEAYMEGLRLFYNYAWMKGVAPRWILPMSWNFSDATTGIDRVVENTYRIGSSFRIPVVPCAIGWNKLVTQEGMPAADDDLSYRHAGYNCALMLYAQFFERDGGTLGFTPNFTAGGIPLPEDAVAARKIERVAWETWQAEKGKSHFSGAYQGNATPFLSNGGRGYHFGTSTRAFSVDKMFAQIGSRDPELSSFAADSSEGFSEVAVPGTVQNNLADNNYTYMWRQDKEGDDFVKQTLNDVVRTQFGEDPYFVWFRRYADMPGENNALMIGYTTWRELNAAFLDNQDTVHNPNRRSRAPQSHIGWGRIVKERTDIKMMEDDMLHATGPVMSMFAAQLYTLLTGRDASRYGSWEYDPNSQPQLAEQAHYAQRVGFTTVMQAGNLDIHEPYDQSPYDLPFFNPNSVYYTPPISFHAEEDEYTIAMDEVLDIGGPGVMGNDQNLGGIGLRPNLTQNVDWFGMEFTLNPDGSFHFVPPQEEAGDARFRYDLQTLADPVVTSNQAGFTIHVLKSDAKVVAQPGQSSTLSYTNPSGGGVEVQIPANAISEPTNFLFTAFKAPSALTALSFAGQNFTIRALRNHQEVQNLTFQQPLSLTITYTDAAVAGLDENKLRLFYFDEAHAIWQEDGITILARDPDNNRIVVQIAHLTEFSLGTVERVYLPVLSR